MFGRPKIGITGPDKGGWAAWFFTALQVLMARGWPVRIRPGKPRTIDGLSGLIVGGGADVDPNAYQQEEFIDSYLRQTLGLKTVSVAQRIWRFVVGMFYPITFFIRKLSSRTSHKLDTERDALEFNLVDAAVKHGLPVLGICRGAQLINVYFRGDLYEDINSMYLEEVNKSSVLPVKWVSLTPGSKLATIARLPRLRVNALHHQAVKKPGEGIIIVAREKNGIVQAIESVRHPFIIGVQWHPEYLLQKRAQRRLFIELIRESRRVKQNREKYISTDS